MRKYLLMFGLFTLLGCGTFGVTACASFPTASQISSTAATLGEDGLSYAQTLAKAFQTVNTVVQVASPLLTSVASQWGLIPANSQQLAIYNTVVSTMSKVSGDITAVNGLLANNSLEHIVATSTNASAAAYIWLLPPSSYCVDYRKESDAHLFA